MVRRVVLLALAVLAASGILASVPSAQVVPPPSPVLSGQPSEWSNDPNPAFNWTPDAGTFRCSWDSPTFADCTSPANPPSPLGAGGHTFQVVAVDAEGNESAPTSYSWTIDLLPPQLPDITAEAVSPAGANVTFAATDNSSPPAPPPTLTNCTTPSGSTFQLGTTPVTCTATDAAGNPNTESFSVTVQDTTRPTLLQHRDVIQQSSGSTTVAYSLPVAEDLADPSPSVECSPASRSVFDVGSTPVTCTATDNAGLTSLPMTFDVIVQTGPAPGQPGITASVPKATRSSEVRFDLVLTGISAECVLDRPTGPGDFAPCANPQTYSGLGEGPYLFTVRAENALGNISQATYAWTVDRTAPERVAGFAARTGSRAVKLRWTKPIDVDYLRIRIWRKRATGGDWKRIATRRGSASFTDRKVHNHVRYLYRIRSFDLARNRSVAAQLSAWPSPLRWPKYDSIVHSPPLVDWPRVRHASYYNLQVWRDGRKLLSVWPSNSQYRLRSIWRFHGAQHTLAGGRVTVFVWAGFGPKSRADYGPLYGKTRFRLG
jgi:HYR domain